MIDAVETKRIEFGERGFKSVKDTDNDVTNCSFKGTSFWFSSTSPSYIEIWYRWKTEVQLIDGLHVEVKFRERDFYIAWVVGNNIDRRLVTYKMYGPDICAEFGEMPPPSRTGRYCIPIPECADLPETIGSWTELLSVPMTLDEIKKAINDYQDVICEFWEKVEKAKHGQ